MYDNTPPVISDPLITGTPGANGWYINDVTVRWTASDPESGIVEQCPSTILTESTPGAVVSCTVTNGAGLSSTASLTIRIDKTPPVIAFLGNAGTYTADQTVNITCTATDSPSGIAANTCASIAGPAYSFQLGLNAYSAEATDNAGTRATASVSFTVQATPGSVANITQQFVTDPGVAVGMVAKLSAAADAAARGNANAKAGAIHAYINQVQALAGKSLTLGQAAILIGLAQAL